MAERSGQALLTDADPPPFTILNAGGRARCLLICDHAGSAVPSRLGNLGLTEEDLGRHWAVDVGARAVTEKLSAFLDAPALLGNISRAVVDLNRRVGHPTLFIESGEGTLVPGNTALGEEARQARIAEIYDPYHAALEGLIDGFTGVPAIVSIHSFTPVFYGAPRPWDIGFLWLQDRRLPERLIGWFRERGYAVGDNEPYDARVMQGTTLDRHADSRGLPNALVEIRNDHIDAPDKAESWARLLADALTNSLADETILSFYTGPKAVRDPAREDRYFDELVEEAKRNARKA